MTLDHYPPGSTQSRRYGQAWFLFLSMSTLLLAGATSAAATTARFLGPAGKCLGVVGAEAAGAAVALETCTDGADQVWHLPTQGFSGAIQSASGLCLDVVGASLADNTGVQLFGCHGGDNQAWRYDGSGLVGVTGKCLSIKNGGTLDGTPAVIFTCHGGDNQRFLAETQNEWSRITGDTGRRGLSNDTTWVTSDPAIFYNSHFRDGGRAVIERSEDAGQTWSVLSALPVGSRFLLDDVRDPNVFFFKNSEGQYLFRSADGGRSYQAVLATGGQGVEIVQDPTRHARFYVAVGQQLLKSEDGGLTFVASGTLPAAEGSLRLVFDANGRLYFESTSQCFFTGCETGAGLFRSTDGGATWQALTFPFPPDFATLYPHPAQGQVLYLHNQVPSGSGQFLRSEDSGATWTEVRTSAARFFYTTPVAPNSIWAIEFNQLVRSDDRGTTWTTSELPLPAPFDPSNLKLSYGPGLRIRAYATEGLDTYRIESLDGGTTWDGGLESRGELPFSSMLATAKAGRYFSMWGAELWRTDDGARTWQKVHEFQNDGRFDQIVADPINAERIYLRTAVDRFWRSVDGGATFAALPGPAVHIGGNLNAVVVAGQTVLLDLSPNSVELARSLDGGTTWSTVTLPQNVTYLRVDGSVVYGWDLAEGVALRSVDGGVQWQVVRSSEGLFHLAAGGGRVAFIGGAEEPQLEISSDFGATWTVRTLPAGAGWERFVSIDAQGRLYLQDSTYQLLRSSDDGLTWELFGRGLPRISREILADPFDPARIFALGRNVGPYFAGTGDLGIWSGRFEGGNELLLGNGRFAARLTWRDSRGTQGVGTPVVGTNDTGFFWLFTPNRAEVAVKLLDGRPLNGRFWVFVASLSNVEFDLEIEDLVEGRSHVYHNAQGQMASFADTQTFPLDGPEFSGAAYQPSLPALLPQVAQVELLERFEVTVAWQDFGGQSGQGFGGQLNEESAGFYFFDPSNLELVVNVIDGRAINGHYWVFFAGLSNVEYSLQVRDKATGAVQVYHNPLGVLASSADTEAFSDP